MSDNCRVQRDVMQVLEHHFRPIDIEHFTTAVNKVVNDSVVILQNPVAKHQTLLRNQTGMHV